MRRVVRNINTPHVPHNWEARLLFEEKNSERYGWEPSISLSEGLARTYTWIYDQLAQRQAGGAGVAQRDHSVSGVAAGQ